MLCSNCKTEMEKIDAKPFGQHHVLETYRCSKCGKEETKDVDVTCGED